MKPKYELGKNCRKGHILTKETTYYRDRGNYLVCRLCKAETDREYRIKNQDSIQQRQLRWSKLNPERKSETSRKNSLKTKYGLSLDDFNLMLEQQKGKCAICQDEPTPRLDIEKPHKFALYVDHCHTTNKIRGLLCWNCNVALGHFKDDPIRLTAAIVYLSSGGT